MRVKAFAAFCLTLLFAALCALPEDTAHAQGSRRRAQPPAPQAAAQQPDRPKQVIIGRGADSQRGSRMTITSDEALNDYSAYRSGDRFYVELPNANAATSARAAGRGFTDLQVQRRGKNVVLSYRVQPGAKPRVEQRFNRLEVIFEVPQGEAAQSAPTQTQTQPPAANPAPTQAARGETPAQTAAQPQPAATRTPETTPASQTPQTNPTTAVNEQQPTAAPLPAEATASPVEQPSTAATQAAPQELAQAQPPAPAAPATTTNNAAAQPGSGTSIGAFLTRNWAVVLVAALLLAGLGLLIASRRTAAATTPPAPAALKQSPAVKLDEPRPTTTATTTASAATVATKGAVVAAPVAAAAAASKEEKKESKKAKKARKAREAREASKTPAAAAPVAETTAETVAETTAEPAAETQTPATMPEVVAPVAVEEVAVKEVAVEEVAVEAAPVEEVAIEEVAVEETVTVEAAAPAVSEPEIEETVEAAPVEKGIVAAVPAQEDETVETFESVEPAAVVESSTAVAPFVALDPDRAHAETRLLLEGSEYDRAILSTSDAMARQMIGSELLSALAGRNAERHERARAAFKEFGYFEEKVEDLRTAEAGAERSAAARSLGLAGERAATPHLVAALEDEAVEVRRAAVESLANLRDPSAVAGLEALLEREKKSKTKVNRKLVEHAIQTCREGVAEVAEVETVAPAAEVTHEAAPAVEAVEESSALEPVAEASVAQPETSAATWTAETTETLVSEERGLEPVPADEPSLFFNETPAAVAEEPAAVGFVAPSEETAAPASLFDETETVESAPVAVETEVEAAESSSGVMWEEPAAVFEEEAAASPPSEAPAVEEAPAFSFEEAAPAVEDVESRREERAEEWVELDMSGLSAPPPAEPAALSEPIFETSGGEAVTTPSAELPTPEPAPQVTEPAEETEVTEATRATAFEEVSIEPAPRVEEFEVSSPAFETSAFETSASFESSSSETFAPAFSAPAHTDEEKSVAPFDEHSSVPANIQQRLASREPGERAAAVAELARVDTSESFHQICAAFDDEARDVRSAAARALYDVQGDRADSFTRALREAPASRRRNIGAAIATSGLASEAISQLTGESREKTYEAFSLLFLMAKAGEVAPLVRAIEGHPNNEVRLAVVKLLALSGQKEILPAFRRLAVRGSLPTEVRSAVMEAIYQISSQTETTPAA